MSPNPSAQPPSPADPADAHAPAPVDWSEESTAGEEDPGASLDLALDPPPQQADPAPPDAAQPPSKP